MAKEYDLLEWFEGFERDKGEFNCDTDALMSKSLLLSPGRFYVLNYKAQTKKPYNARPVILSLGNSKKEPDSFLCVDLCVIPKKMRIQFVQFIFDLFKQQILKNMENYWNVADADKQEMILKCNYEILDKIQQLHPFKNAIKRYKIQNTVKVYSVPFSNVYKLLGNFTDKNFFINSNIVIEQKNFLDKAKKK